MKPLMIKIATISLRILAVIVIGFFFAISVSVIVINIGYFIAPDFTYFGAEGYEATGPIGFILGALIGLIGSSMLFFRRRK